MVGTKAQVALDSEFKTIAHFTTRLGMTPVSMNFGVELDHLKGQHKKTIGVQLVIPSAEEIGEASHF